MSTSRSTSSRRSTRSRKQCVECGDQDRPAQSQESSQACDGVGRSLGPHFRDLFLDLARHGQGNMAPVRVKPTQADVAIADGIATRAGRPTEHVAEALTWGADEHVLCAIAFGWWLYARTRDMPVRRASDHILLSTLVASALPHVLKTDFRPGAPGPLDGARTPSRNPAIRKAARCLSVRTRRPCRCLGIGSDRAATNPAECCLGSRRRSGGHAGCLTRTLDE